MWFIRFIFVHVLVVHILSAADVLVLIVNGQHSPALLPFVDPHEQDDGDGEYDQHNASHDSTPSHSLTENALGLVVEVVAVVILCRSESEGSVSDKRKIPQLR